MTKKLLAIRLRSMLAAVSSSKDKNGNTKRNSRGKIIAYAFIYALLILFFLWMVFSLSYSLALTFIPIGAADIYYGIFMLLSLSVLFIFSIFETKSELFECKDNNLLLAMPIKPKDIMISRIAAVLVYNYLVEAIIMIPVIFSACILGGSAVSAIGAFIVFLIIPLPATALSSGVGYLVHLASVKFAKFKNIAIIALSLGFMALYFLAYYSILENLDSILEDLGNNAGNLGGGLAAIAAIGSATSFAPISFILFILLSAGITALAAYLISLNYVKLMTVSYGTKKTEYKEKTLVKKSAFSAIVRKEFSRFLTSPTYILNGGLGLIFEIIAAVFIAINGPKIFELDPSVLLELGITVDALSNFLTPLFAAGLLFCASMSMISSSALSLEGKSLWIIKSMPIEPSTVLFAKAAPNAILNVAVSVISGLIAAIGMGASIVYYPVYVLIPALGGLLFALAGIIINVLIPKFDFINEAQVVKQSTATFLSMLFNVIISIGILVLSLIAAPLGALGSYLLIALIALLCGAMYMLIKGPIARKYSTL